MKAVWKGSIAFGLVNIPVALYLAVDEQKISFRQLHAADHGPIEYRRVCTKCGEEVSYDEIVKGFEVQEGEYYVFTREELDELRVTDGNNRIVIDQFVVPGKIDPILPDKHYFVGPREGAQHPYHLLQRALEEKGKVAVGKFTMRTKEHLALIRSYRDGLLLSTLNYTYEAREFAAVPNVGERPEFKKRELELATELVEKMSEGSLDLAEYRDNFAQNLKKAIKEKAGIPAPGKGPAEERPENLIQALEASLSQ